MTDRAREADGEEARETRDRQVMEVLQELRGRHLQRHGLLPRADGRERVRTPRAG